MKKSLFLMAAASALMLTACTSENDVLQTATQQEAPKAVGFDVYTQNSTNVTRAGATGIMNTTRLQTLGFGIFGYYTDQSDATAREYPYTTAWAGEGEGSNNYVPNFMYNEKVTWDNTSKGWLYSPLKYWPNETVNDSQEEPAYMEKDVAANKYLDQLTFFAYGPYVGSSDDYSSGITAITAKTGIFNSEATASDPKIEYTAPSSVTDGVDLLWGVAPAGGQHYTAVNGDVDGADEGLPYLNLTKPDVNTSLKFYFQHALARFGFTVAAAIDQVPQGGTIAPETNVTVESVNLEGYISAKGILNLNNSVSNVANWISLNDIALAKSSDIDVDGSPIVKRTITINGANLNPDIKDNGSATIPQTVSVTGAKKDLLQARYYEVDKPTTVKAGDKYYVGNSTDGYTEQYAEPSGTIYYKDGNDYIKVKDSKQYPTTYYTISEGAKLSADPTGEGTYLIYEKNGDDFKYTMTFTPSGSASGLIYSGEGAKDYYTFPTPSETTATFTWPDAGEGKAYYKAERSYYMVVPTNNVPNICTDNFGTGHDDNNEALRTVWVTITYYVTTEDSKLNSQRSRIKNVITKKVVLPSLDNGKSYNLHLVLGLTSVKVEAEVGDWSEEFIQTDLPQNTPGE